VAALGRHHLLHVDGQQSQLLLRGLAGGFLAKLGFFLLNFGRIPYCGLSSAKFHREKLLKIGLPELPSVRTAGHIETDPRPLLPLNIGGIALHT